MAAYFQCIVGRFLVAGVALLLLACEGEVDMFREYRLKKLQPGIATEEQVRKIMGEPAAVWPNLDGSHTLEYPMGPQGIHTWMVMVSSAGMMRSLEQVLTDDKFAMISSGMDADTVRRLLGKPRSVVQFSHRNEEVWDWKFRDAHGERYFNVHFALATMMVRETSFSEDFRR